MITKTILVSGDRILDDAHYQELLRVGYDISSVSQVEDVLGEIKRNNPCVWVLQLPMLDDGDRVFDRVFEVKQQYKKLPVILLVNNSSEQLAIKALKSGINDFYKYPVSIEQIRKSIERLGRRIVVSENNSECSCKTLNRRSTTKLLGDSVSMQKIRKRIQKCCQSYSNVLITGETGTGKELVAKLLHEQGARSDEPLVCVNCAAIPDSLLESELFGYEKGAFTGAQFSRDGQMMHANNGTLFLDEIGDMTPLAQAKILRAIETRYVQRVGGKRSIPVNVRIIAATNQDLETLLENRLFRKDLFFRLNVARIHLPPLRDRKEDIPTLCQHFIQQFNAKFDLEIIGVEQTLLPRLMSYRWSGNVRELRNVIEAAFINRPYRMITDKDLPEEYQDLITGAAINDEVSVIKDNAERDKLLVALLSTDWNKSKAAKKLQWSRMTLYRKIRKYRLNKGVLEEH